jgi:protein transport protein SEC24
VSNKLTEIYAHADHEAIVSLIAKMGRTSSLLILDYYESNIVLASDRSITSSIQEAREAVCNVACDVLKVSTTANKASNYGMSLPVSYALRLLPIYMLSMIKSVNYRIYTNKIISYSYSLFQAAFRAGTSTKIDERAYQIELCKTLPTGYLMSTFYPNLYPIHTIEDAVSCTNIVC